MTAEEDRLFRAYLEWQAKDGKRVDREWSHEWDGTVEHGNAINDRQCERIQAAQGRIGISIETIRKGFRIA